MIRTETRYVPNERTYINSMGDKTTHSSITKKTTWDTSIAIKLITTLIIAAVSLTISSFVPLWIAILLNILLGFTVTRKVIRGQISSEKIELDDIASSLRDEAKECIMIYKKMLTASELTPEGSGIRMRTEEYGRMLWSIMQRLTLLKEANSLVGGKSGAFYANVTKIKNELSDLERAGYDLVELTAYKRMDSVMQDIELSGIKEFKESVNNETMVYRALMEGDSA